VKSTLFFDTACANRAVPSAAHIPFPARSFLEKEIRRVNDEEKEHAAHPLPIRLHKDGKATHRAFSQPRRHGHSQIIMPSLTPDFFERTQFVGEPDVVRERRQGHDGLGLG